MKKRIFIGFLCVALVFAMGACTKKKEEAKKPAKKVEEKKTEKKEEPVVPDAPNTDLLTGLPTLSEEAIGKRPVAVMVNNVQKAMPQYGTSEADIIFEIPVEGDATRFMALYGDYTKLPMICPIRSCRAYFPAFSESFDAFYVHWGMDDTMAEYISALGIDRFDGITGDGGLFGRDQDRLNKGYDLEHTGTFNGPAFAGFIKSSGKRLDLREENKGNAFAFNPLNEVVSANGGDCKEVDINFGAQSAQLKYDAAGKVYKKEINGAPQMDSAANTQLQFTNVLILETTISVRDEVGHKEVDWDGANRGYYVSGGKYEEITWSKDANNEKSKIHLTKKDGSELKLNRGKTYIAVNYANRQSFK